MPLNDSVGMSSGTLRFFEIIPKSFITHVISPFSITIMGYSQNFKYFQYSNYLSSTFKDNDLTPRVIGRVDVKLSTQIMHYKDMYGILTTSSNITYEKEIIYSRCQDE